MKGLIYNITGEGKGKSSSAFGMTVRFLGWDAKIAIIQFIKSGECETGERQFFQKFFPDTTFLTSGVGFTYHKGDHQSYAQKAWKTAQEYLNNFDGELLILDELNIALHYQYLDLQEVIKSLKERTLNLNVIITGRYLKDELKDISDLVSEVVNIKHPFEQGIGARKGLDY